MRHLRLVFMVVLVAAALWYWRQPRRSDLDPAAIVLQVQRLNQLATVRFTVQKVIGLKEDKQPVGSESILLILQASVQAGIDLSHVHKEDISYLPDGTLVIRLPKPKILNISVDEKETKVWDRQKTWWTPWVPYSLDLEQRARQEGLKAAQDAALQMGILGQAEQNAAVSIRGLLGLAGVKSVRIVPSNAS